MAHPDTVTRIVDIAEGMARSGGYCGFSFREIAQEIGIKPASVHYHFPTKADLAVALVDRYTDRFINALGAPDDAAPSEKRQQYIAAFARALHDDDKMCLCGMFGAEIESLPTPVAERTAHFFTANLDWLTQLYRADGQTEKTAYQSALTFLSTLEGAMILAGSLNNRSAFDSVAERLA